MLYAKKPAEVKSDLEVLLRNVQQIDISSADIDIDFFKHYYDIFGPRQEMNALNAADRLLSSFSDINYHTLFAHHGDESESRIYLNHFLAVSFGKKDPLEFGQEIKRAIEALEIPLDNPDLKPRERRVEDGRLVVIDPKKITVHMGISTYSGLNVNLPKLLGKTMEAEEKSKPVESKIVVLH